MRRLFTTVLALALLWAIAAPAMAKVVISDVFVNWQGRRSTEVNIRVTVKNPANYTQQGPVIVSLFVRGNAGEAWRKVQEWDDISKIQPGYKVARDYFTLPGAVPGALETGRFQVKATVHTPDGSYTEVEREVVHHR